MQTYSFELLHNLNEQSTISDHQNKRAISGSQKYWNAQKTHTAVTVITPCFPLSNEALQPKTVTPILLITEESRESNKSPAKILLHFPVDLKFMGTIQSMPQYNKGLLYYKCFHLMLQKKHDMFTPYFHESFKIPINAFSQKIRI